MVSVVIAAHNEAVVIGRCLDALLGQPGVTPRDVTVVANGCHDGTAEVARGYGVQVIELAEPGKALALATGDAAAIGFPRIYLDADIELPAHAIAATQRLFDEHPTALAAAPRRRVQCAGCTLTVRGYMAVHQRLPAFDNSLFGRGMIALSREGRARFDTFPTMIADDLFLDSLFSPAQKRPIDDVVVTIEAPKRTGPLLRRLVRVRRGNAELRRTARHASGAPAVRSAARFAWLTSVVLPHPRLIPAGFVYAAITTLAAVLARAPSRGSTAWGQDDSTRQPPTSSTPPTAKTVL